MILVDSNVPMYLVGGDHPHKADANRLLQRLVVEGEPLVTDAEVFQELLHRYMAISRRDRIQLAFDVLRAAVDRVFPIEEGDVLDAKDIAATHPGLAARDALHAAVMRRRGVSRVLTFDRGFDAVAGIERIPA